MNSEIDQSKYNRYYQKQMRVSNQCCLQYQQSQSSQKQSKQQCQYQQCPQCKYCHYQQSESYQSYEQCEQCKYYQQSQSSQQSHDKKLSNIKHLQIPKDSLKNIQSTRVKQVIQEKYQQKKNQNQIQVRQLQKKMHQEQNEKQMLDTFVDYQNSQDKKLQQSGSHVQLKQQYYDFFKDITTDLQNYVPKMPSDKQFQKHKIKFLKGNPYHQKLQSYEQPYITIKYTQRQSTIVLYTVIICMFELEITLLNIDENAKEQQNKIGKGAFGSVRIQSQNGRMFAVKRQFFENKYHLKEFNMMANKHQINNVIKQLAIYKICSLLKIGPAAETQIGFDLICYRDCIEFQIQYCMKIEYRLRKQTQIIVDERRFQKQIKQCLLILHFFGIIHKDIKPANILFSITYNKYVLTDFGISHSVKEKIGYCSETYRQGTLSFMSQQMKNIEKGKTGFVHLYGNDKYSLEISLRKKQIVNKHIQESLVQFEKLKKHYSNKKYEYEYFKLKYYCIKFNSPIKQIQKYWKYMTHSRREQLITIVEKSIEHEKIKSVYDYLSKSQEFKECNLENLRIQCTIVLVDIDSKIKKSPQLQFKNTLRVYGYSQQTKDIIFKLKLEQKYKNTLKIIDKKLDQDNEVNWRDMMLGNHSNYLRKIKRQLVKCQQIKDYKSMFMKYMIILQYSNVEKEKIDVVQKLKKLKYDRTQEESIQEMIRICSIEKKKEKLQYFIQWINIKKYNKERIIKNKNLYYEIGKILSYMGKYIQALIYYHKSLLIDIQLHGQQHPKIARTYYNIAIDYKQRDKKQAMEYFKKSQDRLIVFRIIKSQSYLYSLMGNDKQAYIYFAKSLKIQKLFNKQNLNYAEICGKIEYPQNQELEQQYENRNIETNKQFQRQYLPSIMEASSQKPYIYSEQKKIYCNNSLIIKPGRILLKDPYAQGIQNRKKESMGPLFDILKFL